MSKRVLLSLIALIPTITQPAAHAPEQEAEKLDNRKIVLRIQSWHPPVPNAPQTFVGTLNSLGPCPEIRHSAWTINYSTEVNNGRLRIAYTPDPHSEKPQYSAEQSTPVGTIVRHNIGEAWVALCASREYVPIESVPDSDWTQLTPHARNSTYQRTFYSAS